MFVNGYGPHVELLFWDSKGRVGIVDPASLEVGVVVGGIGGGDVGGFWGILEYFMEGEFLIYGDRSIGLISLS